MNCSECWSEKTIDKDGYCTECGALVDQVLCQTCKQFFDFSVFEMHICNPNISLLSSSESGNKATPVTEVCEIDEKDYQILMAYFEAKAMAKHFEEMRKSTLAKILDKHPGAILIKFNGATVGLVSQGVNKTILQTKLRQEFLQAYEACLKVTPYSYIEQVTPAN